MVAQKAFTYPLPRAFSKSRGLSLIQVEIRAQSGEQRAEITKQYKSLFSALLRIKQIPRLFLMFLPALRDLRSTSCTDASRIALDIPPYLRFLALNRRTDLLQILSPSPFAPTLRRLISESARTATRRQHKKSRARPSYQRSL